MYTITITVTMSCLSTNLDLFGPRVWSHRAKQWRNAGWKDYPTSRLRMEFKLVSLVSLIPSLQIAKAHS